MALVFSDAVHEQRHQAQQSSVTNVLIVSRFGQKRPLNSLNVNANQSKEIRETAVLLKGAAN